MTEQLGGLFIVAMADHHAARTIEAVVVHLFQNACQNPGFTAGFEKEIDFAVRRAPAQHPHVQRAGNKADHLGNPPVFGQVLKTCQRKQDMTGLGIGDYSITDFLKTGPGGYFLVGQGGCPGQCAGTAQSIQDKDLFVRVFLQHHLAGRNRGVVTARKIAADRNRQDLVSLQKAGRPFFRARAGGGRSAVVIGHCLHHLRHVQGGQVHIFALPDTDFERNQRKLHARRQRRQFPDIT